MITTTLYDLFAEKVQRPEPNSTHQRLLNRFCNELRKEAPDASDEELFEQYAEKAKLIFSIPDLPADEYGDEE